MAQPATASGQAIVARNSSSAFPAGISSCSMGVSGGGRRIGAVETELGGEAGLLDPQLGGVDEREEPGRLVPAEAGGVLVDFEHGDG